MKIAVLGAGMVGRAIAIDLSKENDVDSFDINATALAELSKLSNVKTTCTNLGAFDHYPVLLHGFDMVVNAVPGFMGFQTLKSIILAGKDVVDISFFPENALELDTLAKEKNITAIVDCGVAPGMSNLVLGYYNSQMKIQRFECMVGGLPKLRIKPFEYKAPFSPVDVLEEYTRPARYVENGQVVTRPALSEAELIDFEKAGTLESFNTDGLRSILYTMPHIPNMKEKTLRYPGHIDLVIALQKAGFLSHEPLQVKGQYIKPVEFTSALLFNQWKLEEKEEEFTLMKIIINGEMNEKQVTVEYFLYDEYDAASNTSSMARTTGYACTSAVNLLKNGLFTEKGVFPPELIGHHRACFDFVFSYLAGRGVHYKKSIS
jgi:saccharopine dehydrogenase-like NADP-dependent oxidoreductase